MSQPTELTAAGRYIILSAAFLGWMFSGFQMAVMTLTARSATTEFLRSGQVSPDEILRVDRLWAARRASPPIATSNESKALKAIAPRWFSWYNAAFLFGAAFGGLVFGWLGDRVGARAGILLAIGVYLATTLWAYFLDNVAEFYAMAIVIGLVQGGIQSLSRSFYGRLVPREKSGEFFGFFNMMGKFAAVLGPVLTGWVALSTGSSRVAILSLSVLFLAGGVVLCFVSEASSRDPAGRSP